MGRLFLRNATVLLILAAGLLAVLDGSEHRLHVLPADASAAGVFPAALLIAVTLTLIEMTLRRRRER